VEVASFAEIQDEFLARITGTVWCTVATVDAKGRPRTRILHPVWEGSTGWIATGRDSHKAKHLARNPFVSLSYWDPQHQQVYADCRAAWEDDPAEKRRLWDLYKNMPPPLGYDLGIIWQGGLEDPGYGLLKLTPWRIELFALNDLFTGQQPKIWHSKK
jgi:general stress protein 26